MSTCSQLHLFCNKYELRGKFDHKQSLDKNVSLHNIIFDNLTWLETCLPPLNWKCPVHKWHRPRINLSCSNVPNFLVCWEFCWSFGCVLGSFVFEALLFWLVHWNNFVVLAARNSRGKGKTTVTGDRWFAEEASIISLERQLSPVTLLTCESFCWDAGSCSLRMNWKGQRQ